MKRGGGRGGIEPPRFTPLSQPPAAEGGSWRSEGGVPIAYGNSLFVAVGSREWAVRKARSLTPEGVFHTQGLFLAVARKGFLLTSEDGFTWTKSRWPFGATGKGVRTYAFAHGDRLLLGVRSRPFPRRKGVSEMTFALHPYDFLKALKRVLELLKEGYLLEAVPLLRAVAEPVPDLPGFRGLFVEILRPPLQGQEGTPDGGTPQCPPGRAHLSVARAPGEAPLSWGHSTGSP